eukprot:COSAG02_NODE_2199_length_9541_cov_28.299301_7_plen_267_part_00
MHAQMPTPRSAARRVRPTPDAAGSRGARVPAGVHTTAGERTRHIVAGEMTGAQISAEDLVSALPDVTSTLSAAALDFPVAIIRDNFGIPRASSVAQQTHRPPMRNSGSAADAVPAAQPVAACRSSGSRAARRQILLAHSARVLRVHFCRHQSTDRARCLFRPGFRHGAGRAFSRASFWTLPAVHRALRLLTTSEGSPRSLCLACQRLWHMDQDRRRGLGRFAEWVGASGVAQDKLIRTLGLEHAAKADYAVSRTLPRKLTQACHAC